MGDRNDVTSERVGLKQVEQFARAGPEQLDIGKSLEEFHDFAHQGHRIAAGVCNPARKDRDAGGGRMSQRGGDVFDLLQGEQCG